MTEKPISDLRRRMLEDMAVRRLSEKTRADYIKHVEAFTRFLGRSPETACAEDVRRFQVQEIQQGAKPPKMNSQVSALRFFLKITLGRLDLAHALARVARDRALQLALKAVQLDPTLPFAYAKLGNALTVNGQLEQGIAAFERAIALNPNFTDWRFMAPLVYTGQFERALEVAERHKRFDPFYPPLLQLLAGFAYYMLKEYLRAIPLMLDGASRVPRSRWCHTLLAATFAQLGRSEDARMEALEVLRIDPSYSIQGTEKLVRPFKFPEHAEHFFDGLRKAGLPDR